MHYCWFNGKISEAEKATFHFYDLAVLRGYGLFDYFRTYNGRPFQWDWYWERYSRSSRFLGIPNPIGKEEAYEVVMKLFEKQGGKDCAFRFILTGGFTEDSITMVKPNLIIVSETLHENNEQEYIDGISVMTHEYVRDLPTIKSIDYKHLLLIRPEMFRKGFSDILLHHNGLISELSRSNIFIVKDGVVITPHQDILEGITRKTILSLAEGEFEVQLRNVSLEETLNADEVFTTSTTKRVLPITRIDDKIIGNGGMGKVSRQLLDKINLLVENW